MELSNPVPLQLKFSFVLKDFERINFEMLDMYIKLQHFFYFNGLINTFLQHKERKYENKLKKCISIFKITRLTHYRHYIYFGKMFPSFTFFIRDMAAYGKIRECQDDDDDDGCGDQKDLREEERMELLRCNKVRHSAFRYRVRSMELGRHCDDGDDDQGGCPSDLRVVPSEDERNSGLQNDDGVQRFACQCVRDMELDRHCGDGEDGQG